MTASYNQQVRLQHSASYDNGDYNISEPGLAISSRFQKTSKVYLHFRSQESELLLDNHPAAREDSTILVSPRFIPSP
jgi:hypothetical protein